MFDNQLAATAYVRAVQVAGGVMFDLMVIVAVQCWARVAEAFSLTCLDPFERAAQSMEDCRRCGCSQKIESCLRVKERGEVFQALVLIAVMIGRLSSDTAGRNDSMALSYLIAADVIACTRKDGTVQQDQSFLSCLVLSDQRMHQMLHPYAKRSSAAMLKLVNRAPHFAAS